MKNNKLELKARAYDILVVMQNAQAVLQDAQKELNKVNEQIAQINKEEEESKAISKDSGEPES